MALVSDTECLLAKTNEDVGRSDVDDDDRRHLWVLYANQEFNCNQEIQVISF